MSAQFIPLTDGVGLALAYNISRLGQFVVGEIPPVDNAHGPGGIARLVKGKWQVSRLPTFSSVDGHASPAFGVNDTPTVVGYGPQGAPSLDTPYHWSPASAGLKALKMFPGDKACVAYAVSSNSKIVVGYGSTGRTDRFGKGDALHHALIWDRAGGLPHEIDPSPVKPEEDVAVCVSSSGNAIAGFAVSPLSKPKLYDPAAYSRGHEPICWLRSPGGVYHRSFLPSLNGFEHSGRVLGINPDGDRVVGFVGVRAASVPVRWTFAGATRRIKALPNLPGFASGRAAAVSSDGSVITGNCLRGDDDNFEAEAFVWNEATGMRNLADVLLAAGATEVNGWDLTDAPGLSSDGRWLCGNGWNPAGGFGAWVAHL
jgi:uncharacterized membrane protein